MAALTATAAMATATIEPEEQSRMMIPFSLAAYYYDFSEIPPPIEIAPLWSCPSVSLFGLRGKEGFEWRSRANVSYSGVVVSGPWRTRIAGRAVPQRSGNCHGGDDQRG